MAAHTQAQAACRDGPQSGSSRGSGSSLIVRVVKMESGLYEHESSWCLTEVNHENVLSSGSRVIVLPLLRTKLR